MSEQDAALEAEKTAETVEAPVRDYEKEAREMGWVPETEFKGEKDRWKPADQFVQDGERILPIVRSQLKREREEREREKADFAKRTERLEKMAEENLRVLTERHAAELASIRSKQREAVEAGDLKEFDRLEKAKDGLEKAAPKAEPKVEKEDAVAVYQGKVAKFKEANAWYETDDVMTAYADRISGQFAADNPSISFEENTRKTLERVKEKFPDKFKTPAANGHAAVDSGSDFSAVRPKGTLASKLTAEEKRHAEQAVANKFYDSVEAWAKVYFKK